MTVQLSLELLNEMVGITNRINKKQQNKFESFIGWTVAVT